MAADRDVRIAEIRQQIATGTYETPENLAAAVDALWQQEFSGESGPVRLTSENLLKNEGAGERSFGRRPFRE